MRRFNLLVVTIILLALFSAEITLAKETYQPAVRTLAINFLERRNIIRVTASQQRSPLILTSINEFRAPAEKHIMAYIAHVAPKGFIILSADSDIEQILQPMVIIFGPRPAVIKYCNSGSIHLCFTRNTPSSAAN